MNNANTISLIIADDEEFIRQGMIEIVSNKQDNINLLGTASNGIEAIHLIQTLQPDIAIMDIKMPGLDGLEVIRQSQKDGCSTRFIILSGYDDFNYAQKAIKYGAKEYFLKPLNIEEFIKTFHIQCQQILEERQKKEPISSAELHALVSSSRTFFLNQLLQNKISATEISTDKLSFLNLTIENSSCCSIVFLPDSRSDSTSTMYDLCAIVEEEMYPLFQDYHYATWIYNDVQLTCIINISSSDINRVKDKLQLCMNSILRKHSILLNAGMGHIVAALHLYTTSYQQALQALSYRIYETNHTILDSSIICQQKPTSPTTKIDSAALTSAILCHDIASIKNYCNTFFQALFFVKMPPPNYLRGMCMFLITNVQKEIELQQNIQDKMLYFTYEDLDAIVSVQYLKDWLTDIFVDFSNEINNSSSSHDKIIQTAKKYIMEHIDQAIKAKDIADQVNLSEAYFAIYFKNYSGENFRNYVLREKMHYAKRLIAAKKLAISEIAFQVGYQDYRSFSRAFKNIVGQSPSGYLESLQNQ